MSKGENVITCKDCGDVLFTEEIDPKTGKYHMKKCKKDFRQAKQGEFLCLECMDKRIVNLKQICEV